MLHFFDTFRIYTWWSLEFLITPPYSFITIAIAINLVVSVFKQRPFKSHKWQRIMRLPFIVFLCFPATLTVAATGYVNVRQVTLSDPNYWGLRVCDFLMLISLGAGAYWTFRLKGLRWFAASITLLQLGLLVGANIIAGMALTGDWI
jgi:hypothetical protein